MICGFYDSLPILTIVGSESPLCQGVRVRVLVLYLVTMMCGGWVGVHAIYLYN